MACKVRLAACVLFCWTLNVAIGQSGRECVTSAGFLGDCIPRTACRRSGASPCGGGRVCCERVTTSFSGATSRPFNGNSGAAFQRPGGGRPGLSNRAIGSQPISFPGGQRVTQSRPSVPSSQNIIRSSAGTGTRRRTLLKPTFACDAAERARRRRPPQQQQAPSGPRQWFCGATLISERYMLTAAHCLHSPQPINVVRLGGFAPREDGTLTTPTEYRVEKVIPHPLYRRGIVYHDLALVRLARRVVFGGLVWPYCLAAPGQDLPGATARVAGIGALVFGGEPSDVLLEASLPIVSAAECEANLTRSFRLPQGITDGLICAGGGAQDACQGDSGGPLTVQTAAGLRLVGVVAAGDGCATPGVPGLYTRVSHYIDWIDSVVYG